MSVPHYIGDADTAAALRLAGVQVYVPGEDEDAEALFQRRLAETDFLLLGTAFAQRLPPQTLKAALQAGQPLVAVIPDVLGAEDFIGESVRLRRELGWGSAT
ncbi:archaeal/vacuolar-type H+-ATPase subunit F [Thiohalobacter thiocyanaticus]|uniref:Archaeal/vacuolar-type H+-ATPase subunit F n=1 Tax=Thiohalobacter thiocyanaticus TaxID=585455 RepID=A0A1Z4VRZ3_9GAMM|nr:V-type ATP synthase subunit F [Thiohalobacter thiocyanaticus]BAZ94399.1 archaeal/vacuolar-type H+-ATPase subunit F [Thiohalobacter thiocyanaticus]